MRAADKRRAFRFELERKASERRAILPTHDQALIDAMTEYLLAHGFTALVRGVERSQLEVARRHPHLAAAEGWIA